MPRLRTFLFVPFLILFAYSPPACAQVTDSLQYAGQVSAPFRTARYPEVIYPRGILPDWDRGYVLSHGIEKYSSAQAATVVVYDRGGQRIREGHIWPAGAQNVEIFRTAATHDGAVMASG